MKHDILVDYRESTCTCTVKPLSGIQIYSHDRKWFYCHLSGNNHGEIHISIPGRLETNIPCAERLLSMCTCTEHAGRLQAVTSFKGRIPVTDYSKSAEG